MKYIKAFESFLNEADETKPSNSASDLDGLKLLIDELPNTIQYLRVPKDMQIFAQQYEEIKPDNEGKWKEKVKEMLDSLFTKHPTEAKEIDGYSLNSYFGNMSRDKSKDPYYIAFTSPKIREFAEMMSQGKYGSLD